MISGDVSNDAPHSSYELISLIVNVQEQLRPDHMIIGQTHQLRIQLSQLRVCLFIHVCTYVYMYVVCVYVFVYAPCVCIIFTYFYVNFSVWNTK